LNISKANNLPCPIQIATGTKPYKPSEPVGKGNFISASAVIGKTQIGTECVVSDGTTVGDRSSVKKSIIGKHCQIGNNVKIINSVLLDHVTVKDGFVSTDHLVSS
jgi:NDP-sugar pyrophosphorylase family protein